MRHIRRSVEAQKLQRIVREERGDLAKIERMFLHVE